MSRQVLALDFPTFGNLLSKYWRSSSAMMAANTLARIAALAIVTPLVLRRFLPADTAAFYLFSSAIGFQWAFAGGLTATFVRYTSYFYAQPEHAVDSNSSALPRDLKVEDLLATMRCVFGGMALISLVLVGSLGSYMVAPALSATTKPMESWIAWAVVLAASGLSVFCIYQNAFLQGAGWIVREQRTGAIIALGSAISALSVLMLGGGLLALVISNQLWVVVNCGRVWLLMRECLGKNRRTGLLHRDFLHSVWGPSWRSVVGVLMSTGLIYFSTFIYSRLITGAILASYLVGLRLIQIIGEFSRAPFYSKIPEYNRLRAQNRLPELRDLAGRQMDKSFIAYLIPFAGLAFVGSWLFELFGSRVEFLTPTAWCLLGGAFLLDRYCAMHLQLYSTTNHIIWHTVNSLTGLILVAFLYTLQPLIHVHALPVAMLLSYAAYYAWRVPALSCHSIQETVGSFDARRLIWVTGFYFLVVLLCFARAMYLKS